MKIILITLALFIGLNSVVIGQAEINTLTDQSTFLNVSENSFYLEDRKCELDPSNVLDGQHDGQFQKNDSNFYRFGNVKTSYWHRISIQNNDESNQPWYLVIDNHHLDSINFYIPDSLGGYTVDQSGRLIAFDDRSVEYTKFAFKIPTVKGQTQDIYLRVSSYFLNYPIKIFREDAFKKEHSQQRFVFGLVLGFLMMIAFYNLFIYFTVRDKNYLLYILYAFLTIIKISDTNGNMDQLWQGGLSFMRSQSPGITVFTSIAATMFAYYFLNFKKYLPGAIKIILFVFLPLWIGSLVFNMLDLKLYSSIINQLKTIIGIIFLLSCAIIIYRRGYRPARFYMIAEIFIFTAVLLYPLASMGLFEFNSLMENSFVIGAGIEILFFSFALADMINEYKKEKHLAETELVSSLRENEKLIKNQNKLLETKVKERTYDLEIEKEKSDNLLLNILPAQIAEELKISGKTEAKHFEESTIMFTDFVNFTGISANMDPIKLVREVNRCFTAFDHIMEEHKLEKIKTIGDAYLAVCGLPIEDPRHADNVVNAAFAIRNFISEHNKKDGIFEIRIGIHTGPLVAGVVGVKKFAFDIWGDSVNIASRMEEASESGKINISQTTYELVKDICECEHRGKIPIKNRGEVHMYYIEPKNN